MISCAVLWNVSFRLRAVALQLSIVILIGVPVFASNKAETVIMGGSVSDQNSGPWTLAGHPYLIDGNVDIPFGETLTIEPGVEVRFRGVYGFTVNGTLSAIGTTSSRIVFQSDSGTTAGSWQGIVFNAGSGASTLQFADVDHAGSFAVFGNGAITCFDSSPTLGDLSIDLTSVDGFARNAIALETIGFGGVDTSMPTFSGRLALIGSSGYLIETAWVAAVPSFEGVELYSDGSLAIGGAAFWSNFFQPGNSIDPLSGGVVAEVLQDTLAESATWGAISGLEAIEFQGIFTIEGALLPVLTLAPGTTMRGGSSSQIRIGAFSESIRGGLWAVGTPAARIRFEGMSGAGWPGIYFRDGALDGASRLEYCDVVNAGSGGAALPGGVVIQQSTPTLKNVLVDNSATDGIYITNGDASLEACTVQGSGGMGVRVDESSPSLIDITVSGFGSSSAGVYFSGDGAASMTGLNRIEGPGGDGVRFSIGTNDGNPSISGLTLGALDGYVFDANITALPMLDSITVEADCAFLGRGSADFWRVFLGASPSILGGNYRQEVLASTLTGDTVWGVEPAILSVDLLGDLSVGHETTAPTLTLAAGTTVRMADNADLVVGPPGPGGTSLLGALVANGVPGDPIEIGRLDPLSGWGAVFFRNHSLSNSRLAHCNLRNGGKGLIDGTVHVSQCAVVLDNVLVENSAGSGVYCNAAEVQANDLFVDGFGANDAGIELVNDLIGASSVFTGTTSIVGPGGDGVNMASSSPQFENLSIDNQLSGSALIDTNALSIPSYSGSVFIGQTVASIGPGPADFWANLLNASPTIMGTGYSQVVSSSTLSKSVTWGAHTAFSELQLTGILTVSATTAPTLTISKGTDVRLGVSGSIRVAPGGAGVNFGKLMAVGTPTEKITFDRSDPTLNWRSIEFGAGTDAASQMAFCELKNGGRGGQPLIDCSGGTPQLTDLEISFSADDAIRINGAPTNSIVLERLTVNDCANGVIVFANSASTVLTSSSFMNIAGDAIQGADDSLAMVQGCTFDNVLNGILSQGSSSLTIFDCTFNSWDSASGAGVDSSAFSFPAVSYSQFNDDGFSLKLPASAIDLFSNASLMNTISPPTAGEIGVYGNTITAPSRWANVSGVPYRFFGSVTYDAALRIDTGTELRFDPGVQLSAGGLIPAPLTVRGTPNGIGVLFTSSQALPSAGDWNGVSVGPGSSIDYATFEYAGGGFLNSGLSLMGPSVIRSSTFRENNGYGIIQNLVGTSAMAEPTSILSSSVTANVAGGVLCQPSTWTDFIDMTVTGNTGYGVTTGASGVTGIRESNLDANSVGAVSASGTSSVEAAYNWWGDSSGPTAAVGSGTGALISGPAGFKPWFGTAIGTFRLDDPAVSLLAFAPIATSTTFSGDPSAAANWTITVKNSGGTDVFQQSGTNGIDVSWDANDGTDPPAGLPDGAYDFVVDVEDAGSPTTKATLIGDIVLDSTLMTAEIATPNDLQFIRAGVSSAIVGTAKGASFDHYTLEYGYGTQPASFVEFVPSNPTYPGTSPVINGVLGYLFMAEGSSPYVTIRLKVFDSPTTVGAVHTRVVKFQSLWDVSTVPDPFSPNEDEFQDLLTIKGGITWGSSWTLEIRKELRGGGGFMVTPLWSTVGSGTQILRLWNGLRNSGLPAGNGNYQLAVIATPTGTSQTVTGIEEFAIVQSGDAIRIVSPVENAFVANDVGIMLETDFTTEAYTLRLEHGSFPAVTPIGPVTNIVLPFNWDTTSVSNGTVSLTAIMIASDGTMHSDSIDVEVANLVLTSIENHVIDPVNFETTRIDLTSGRLPGTDPGDTLLVEIHEADTTVDGSAWHGVFQGLDSNSIPVWSESKSLALGNAFVTWDGRDNSGVLLASGEYIVRAVANYATDNAQVEFVAPGPVPFILRNDDLSALGQGQLTGSSFDPYYGELVDIQFTLSEPQWITMAFDTLQFGTGVMQKLHYGPGSHVFYWDGRAFQDKDLFWEADPGDTIDRTIFIKASEPPKGLISLRSQASVVNMLEVDPVAIFPTLGQAATITYSLSRDSVVSVAVYDATGGGGGGTPLFMQLLTQVPQTASAGPYSIVFDGTNGLGELPAQEGTYVVELIAEDASGAGYQVVKHHFIQIVL